MPPSSLKITEREVGDVTILSLTGQIRLDEATSKSSDGSERLAPAANSRSSSMSEA